MLKNYLMNINIGKIISNQTISNPSNTQLFLGRLYPEIDKSMLLTTKHFVVCHIPGNGFQDYSFLIMTFPGINVTNVFPWILLFAFFKTLAFSQLSETSPSSHHFPRVSGTMPPAPGGAFQEGQGTCMCLVSLNIP